MTIDFESVFDKKSDGGARATLFGTFYEDIWRFYFPEQGYEPRKGKPRIYWDDLDLPAATGDPDYDRLRKCLDKKKQNNKYCTPDGLLKKDDKLFIWEAKNWIRSLFSGTKPLRQSIWDFPWLLAKTASHAGSKVPIDGFVISWWEEEAGIEEAVHELERYIRPRMVRVFFTKRMVEHCIKEQFDWYVKFINHKRNNFIDFFDRLRNIK